MTSMIRAAREADVPALREIERAAGALFRTVGMDAVAEDEPLPSSELSGYVAAGRAWVAVDDTDRPIGYLLVATVDDAAHIEQLSVDPEHGRLGWGRALIDTARQWACDNGLRRLTLTTFTEVAWNAPYYRRLGFTVVPQQELGAGLREIRRRERQLGLDRWPRCVLQRSC